MFKLKYLGYSLVVILMLLTVCYVGDTLVKNNYFNNSQDNSNELDDRKEIIRKLNELNKELEVKERELISSIAKQINDNLENLSNDKSDVNPSDIRKSVMDYTNEVENKVKEIIVGSEDKKNDEANKNEESNKNNESNNKNEKSPDKVKLNNNQSNNQSKERKSLNDLILDKIEHSSRNNLPYFKNPLIEESMRIREKYKKRAEEREKLNDEKWLMEQYEKRKNERFQNFLNEIEQKTYLDYFGKGITPDPFKKSLWP